MRQVYKEINFKPRSLALLSVINDICESYMDQGFKLTVRQLYYQLVAKHNLPNREETYELVTGLVNDGRMTGVIDWDAIEDRTREFVRRGRWESGAALLDAVAEQFHMDMWDNQKHRVYVVVEKEALVGVFERVCHEYDVPLLAARGYPSVSVLREFAVEDLIPAMENDQECVILHLGDHDPSGIDMTRDLRERVEVFCHAEGVTTVDLHRLALNMDQVRKEKPLPNPAKVSDSRFTKYQELYGHQSWELDALEPAYLDRLVRAHVRHYIDQDRWEERKAEVEKVRKKLEVTAKRFAKEGL